MRRHRLHFEYRWLFAASVGFAALGLFWMIACCIHRNWTYFGLAVGMAILGYMALNNALFSRLGKNLPFKEAGIALTVTVCLAAAPLSTDGMVAHEWIQIALFLCINLINLLQFSYFDRVHDRKAGFASLTAYLESETLRRAIGGVLLVASVFLVALASMRDSSVFILGAMWVVLGLIHLSPGFFAGHDRYRFWGDLIYCFPLLEVIFS